MKKFTFPLLLIFSSFLFLKTNNVFATSSGAIQLINFPSQFNENTNYDFSIPISFIYSGNYPNQLGVSMVSSNGGALPIGASLGSIIYGVNGVDNVILSGNLQGTGDYPLTLIITDNNGALLSQPFDFSVSNNSSLPNAIVNQPYSQSIPFDYADGSNITVSFSAYKDNLQTQNIDFNYSNFGVVNRSVTLKLTPLETGQFTIKADTSLNGAILNTETFNLTVVNPVVTTPVPVIQAPIVVPVTINTPIPKKEILNSETKTQISVPSKSKSVVEPIPTTETTAPAVSTSASVQITTPKHKHWYDWLNPFSWF